MTDRKTLDQMTSDELDALHDQLDQLRAVARGYCPACGRGDAAPTVQDWEQQKQRGDEAETRLAHLQATSEAAGRLLTRTTDERDQLRAAITRVRQLHQPTGVVAAAEAGVEPDCAVCGPNRWPCPTYEAVTEPESAPGPAATQVTDSP